MTRLPTPGGDDGTWGDILNAYLEVSLASNGTLNNNIVGTNQIQNNAVTNIKLDSPTQTSLTKADSAVQSVNGKTGTSVTLAASDVSAVPTSQLGAASGVATLDSGTHLTASQLPSSVVTGSVLTVVNVKDYGAVGDGSTDDAAAIQAGLNAANAAGGGAVYLPAGTYVIGTVLTLYSNILLIGAGIGAATVKVKDASNIDAIISYNFAALTGSNTVDGIHDFEIRDLRIDGNKANQSSGTGNGIKIYGYRYRLTNVRVKNTKGDAIYSEWMSSEGAGDDRDMEAFISDVKTFGAGGAGIHWKGPHDSTFESVFAIAGSTGSYGFWIQSPGFACKFVNCHAWGQSTYAWNVAAGTCCFVNCEAEGGSSAQVKFDANQMVWIGGGMFPGGAFAPVGIEIGSTASQIYVDTQFRDLTSGAVKFTGSGVDSIFKGQVLGTGTIAISGTPDKSVGFKWSCFGGCTDNTSVPSIASAATIAPPSNADLVTVTGTTNITGITATRAGHRATLEFTGALTVVNGTNLRLNGSFATIANSTLTLACDGTNWFEVSRSIPPDQGQAGVYAGKGNATLALTANRAYCKRFRTVRTMAITKVAFGITAASAGNLDLAILDQTGAVLFSLGSTAGLLGSTGAIVVTLGATWNLVANTVYYAVISTSSTPTLVADNMGGFSGAQLFGSSVPQLEQGIVDSTFPITGTLAPAGTTAAPVLALRES